MEFLGIGPLELVFFLLIALILFGPNDMVKAGRTIGRFLRRVVLSEEWRAFTNGMRELQQLPTKLMREAGLEEESLRDLEAITRQPFEQARALMEDTRREFNIGLSGPGANIPRAERNSAAGYGSWSGQAPNPASGVQTPALPEAPQPEPPPPTDSDNPPQPTEDTAS